MFEDLRIGKVRKSYLPLTLKVWFMETNDMHLASLYKYFIWANRLREYFENAIPKVPGTSVELACSDDCGLFMAHWYGAL